MGFRVKSGTQPADIERVSAALAQKIYDYFHGG